MAEIAYLDATGRIGFASVTPLVLDGAPCLALSFDRRELAAALGASSSVALVMSDSRLALKGWRPQAVFGRMDVALDPEGELFAARLLDEELRKHPPARHLIDSPLLRRENWWYLPRLILRLVDVVELHGIARREPGRHGVLAWTEDGRLDVETAGVSDWDEPVISLTSLSESRRERVDPGEATLFSVDLSIPDLERRAELLIHGRLKGETLTVTERVGSLHVGEPPGVFRRLRAARALERGCRSGLSAIEERQRAGADA